jgi:1,4-alpha-glucan branching enzyme
MAILSQEEIFNLSNGNLYDPYVYLGMHKYKKGVVVRTIQPFAKEVKVTSRKFRRYMEKISDSGIFELYIPNVDFVNYKFKCIDGKGNKWDVIDPYKFLPVISDYDIHLFNEGNHYEIYDKLGSHNMKINDHKGTLFAVWAPNAKRVSVVGNFNNWDGRVHQMRMLGSSGIWEIFIPNLSEGDLYKYEIKTKEDYILLKIDPYANFFEKRPKNASIIYDLEGKHQWEDDEWIKNRENTNWLEEPMSIYEVHLNSWMKTENDEFLNYRDIAKNLAKYCKENGFTHVELMPIAEHPLDMSWGYQVTGYFAPTSRFGTPEDFMYFVDLLHKEGIGIILDWVPGHFPKDECALGRYDGTALYEHLDPRIGEHIDWGTYIFNYGRNEVKNFLISNALFWLKKFHIDGLRVDAVASMLYLDYSREDQDWIPNRFGGRENLEAIDFLKHLNSVTYKYFPGTLTIAEESTAFPGVTKPVDLGGLGFAMKWNMGWMNDSLEYMKKEPIYRQYHQNDLTFSIMYAFSENFILSISHDEVVYGKKSLVDKMPGDDWQKFANLRLYLSYMYAHPGKKLLFMGQEFGQWKEWDFEHSLDWHVLQYENHQKTKNFIKSLHNIYKENKPFYKIDFNFEGFEWIDFSDNENSVISFLRKSNDEKILCVFNFTPVPRDNYRIGVPEEGEFELIFNSDSKDFWGSGYDIKNSVSSEKIRWQGRDNSIVSNLPPLSAIFFKMK